MIDSHNQQTFDKETQLIFEKYDAIIGLQNKFYEHFFQVQDAINQDHWTTWYKKSPRFFLEREPHATVYKLADDILKYLTDNFDFVLDVDTAWMIDDVATSRLIIDTLSIAELKKYSEAVTAFATVKNILLKTASENNNYGPIRLASIPSCQNFGKKYYSILEIKRPKLLAMAMYPDYNLKKAATENIQYKVEDIENQIQEAPKRITPKYISNLRNQAAMQIDSYVENNKI